MIKKQLFNFVISNKKVFYMKIFTKISIALAIMVLSLFSTLKAQTPFQIPNSGFDNTEVDATNGNVGYRPVGWYASNVYQSVLVTVKTELVTPEPNGRTGSCIYLHNEASGALGITAPAYATISLGRLWNNVSGIDANSAIGGTLGGINFTHRPDTMQVWVKRTLIASDGENAHLMFYLWSGTAKANSYISKGGSCRAYDAGDDDWAAILRENTCGITQYANLIGQGHYIFGKFEQYPDWTLIKVPITYNNNSIPEKVNIAISAANFPTWGQSSTIRTGSKLWADDLNLVYSSKVHEIRVDVNGTYRPIPNVEENIYDYTYVVREGVTSAPNIQVFRSGRQITGSEITVVNGVIDGAPTVITVRAEDNSANTSTYRVHFVSTQSTNAFPAGISVNGTPISNFNQNIYTYNVALPYGTTTCPTITVQKAEGEQTFDISPCVSVTGTRTVTVYAQDISVSKTYTLNFTIAPLNDNTLADIKVNGVTIPGFKPTTNNYYNVELPLGTTTDPVIEYVSAYPVGAQTIVMNNGGLSGTTTIQVSSPASNVRTYKITFVVVASSYAYLDDIKVGGVSISGFNAETLNYNYQLPRGTTTLPPITWTLGEANQTVSMVTNGVNGETLITVTAQNGTAKKYYRINFSVERSDIATLNDIKVGGVSVPNFTPYNLEYNIELPSGTTSLPEITYVLGDYAQTVKVTTNGVNGTTTIRVNAENPQSYLIYKLNFSVALSANSQLNNILVNGFSLDGFAPEILNYTYILPSNATQCPNIDVVKATAGQQVYITKPALTGIATIRVVSEVAGGGENIYTINFQFTLSSTNTLNFIKLDGVPVAGFNSYINSYTVNLQPNTPAPAVEYQKSDPTSNVFVTDNGVNGLQITVTAQNGAIRTYSINYNIVQTNNVNLANIEIWNNTTQDFVSLAGFNPSITEYQYPLTWRTNPIPAINPVAAENGQVITVFYSPVNDTAKIQVVASNGIDKKTYKVYFPVAKSNFCALSSILVDGFEIQDLPPYLAFDPQVLNYNITLPYGTNQTPNVTFVKGKIDNQTVVEQQIEATAGSISEPYKLKVIAEDGTTTQTYTLNFSVDLSAKSGDNYLENIFVNNIPVENFNSQTFAYNVVLPYGTTELPNISFAKKYPEQTVTTDLSGVVGTSKITVFANDNNVSPTEYSINFSVSDKSTATLSSISFNNVVFANFDPRVHSYIVPLDIPDSISITDSISYTYDEDNLFAYELFSNSKKFVIQLINQDNAADNNTYTFWYYYTNDTIPNASFEDWSATKFDNSAVAPGYNALKPTGWQVAADNFKTLTRSSYPTYYSGNEVIMSDEDDATEGSYSAFVRGLPIGTAASSTAANATKRILPGVMTLGDFKYTSSTTAVTASNPATSVSGGINFRNTPDAFNFDYKWNKGYTNNTSGINMRAVVQLWNNGADYAAAERVTDNTYTGTNADWTSITRPLVYSADNVYPQRLNIILSANGTESPFVTAATYSNDSIWGKLWVDNVKFGYSSVLTNIYINGVAVGGFNGNDNSVEYQATVPADVMMPVITFDNQVADQEVRYTISDENSDRQRTVTLISKAEDSSTTEYTLVLTREIAAVDTLAGISIDGVAIADFAADNFEYNVTVPNGILYSPDIAAIKGEGHQTISYSIGNKQVSITVTAEDGIEQQTYTVNFVEEKSNDATLANLAVEGYETAFVFDALTTQYQVHLSSDLQDIPNILFTKNSDGQTVTLTTCAVNGTATISVAAEDSINFTDYKIVFTIEPTATSHLLSEISVDNLPIANFAQTNFNYTVDFGKVIFTREFAQDLMNVVYYGDSVKCIIGANNYKITFDAPVSDNAYLSDIVINGVSISGFAQTQFTYTQSFNGNLPDVSAVSGAEGQTITYTWNGNSITISVTAQDGITQNYYVVNFVPAMLSSNALLSNILISGVSVNNFLPNTFNYSYTLPEDATLLPVIQTVKGEVNQTVVVTTNGVSGATTILVTAQNGTTATYTINFTVALSSNALLSGIFISGSLIDDFASNKFYYEYELPYGTTTLPEITYTEGHANQTYQIQANGVHGNYIIKVTSENGQVFNQYVIAFRVALSANGYLNNILANGVQVPNFDQSILEYRVEVPCGTTEVPAITWVKGDANQLVVPTYAQTLSDTTKLLVTSENGVNQNLYKIYFDTKPSSNVLLADIIIGGESLTSTANGYITDNLFDAEQFEYNITLPYGTTVLPTISATAQGSAECSSINIATTGNVVNIDVLSQDGSVNSYDLYFTVALSDNSQLLDISLRGASIINNFTYNNGTFEYNIQYPVHSNLSVLATDADITYVKAEEHQNVAVELEPDGTTIRITVTAQDGSQTPYVITQEIIKSNNALLADILIDGKSIQDFDPNVFEYTYLLPLGSTQIPTVEGIKQEDEQELEYSLNNVGEATYIIVTAEDGSENVYSILFKESTEVIGLEPTKNDVCWGFYGDGVKFTSTKSNVSIMIFDLSGRVVYKSEIPVADPNYDVCDADGATFSSQRKGEIYLFTFIYNNKKKIKDANGKFSF